MKKALWILWIACGTVAILWLAAGYLLGGICQGPILQSLNNDDKSVKASLYETDCGAMTATRSVVALSAWYVDGRRHGDPVVTFFGIHGGGVRMNWRTSRELVISYPANTEIEYAVSKIRGVKIYLQPD
jgi:hypothetical protein